MRHSFRSYSPLTYHFVSRLDVGYFLYLSSPDLFPYTYVAHFFPFSRISLNSATSYFRLFAMRSFLALLFVLPYPGSLNPSPSCKLTIFARRSSSTVFLHSSSNLGSSPYILDTLVHSRLFWISRLPGRLNFSRSFRFLLRLTFTSATPSLFELSFLFVAAVSISTDSIWYSLFITGSWSFCTLATFGDLLCACLS